MSDPFVGAAKAAVTGIREALDASKEVEALAKDISALGDAELQARAAYRKKSKVVQGDYVIIDAVEEWTRLNEVLELEKQLRNDVIQRHGKQAWEDILKIKERHIKDRQELRDEFGRDSAKMRALKWWCFIAAFFVTSIAYLLGYKP